MADKDEFENQQDVLEPEGTGAEGDGRALDLPSSIAVPDGIDLDREVGKLTGIAAVVILVFFFGSLAWAFTAEIAASAIAPGRIVYEGGTRQRVSHEQGGQIARFFVNENSAVSAGDILLEFDPLDARTRYQNTRTEYVAAVARWDRLEAERSNESEPVFREILVQASNDAAIYAILSSERDLFIQRRQTLEGQRSILRQRVAQLEEQISGLQVQIRAQEQEMALIDQEIAGVQELVDRGLERLPRLLALQRNKTRIEGERGENRAAIARAREAIGEAEFNELNLIRQYEEEIADELSEVRRTASQLEQEYINAAETLGRMTVAAPVSGRIETINYNVGEAVRPGDPILEIVPSEGQIRIEARVDPKDIEAVHPGLNARIQIVGSTNRNTPFIFGEVSRVARDSTVDQATGMSYFVTTIRVPEDELQKVLDDGDELIAGMQTQVFINLGERTLFEYFWDPIQKSWDRSFQEK